MPQRALALLRSAKESLGNSKAANTTKVSSNDLKPLFSVLTLIAAR